MLLKSDVLQNTDFPGYTTGWILEYTIRTDSGKVLGATYGTDFEISSFFYEKKCFGTTKTHCE